MSEHDPVRWLRSATSEEARLSTLLEAGRAERPSSTQLNALAKRLEPTFSTPPSGAGGAGGASGAAGGAATGASFGSLAPVAIGVLLALGVATAWLSNRGADPGAFEAPRRAPPTLQARPRAQPVRAAQPASGSQRSPAVTPEAAPVAVVADAATAPSPAPSAKPGAVERAQDPAAELALLEEAHRALTTDPRRTLELAETHRRRFAHGVYEQEREVLAIEALLALHDAVRAQRRATRFLARHPESSHARRVHALLAQSRAANPAGPGAQVP